ncbi:MAG: xylan 1,4-beta-xylosidase [Kiritimatiellae bacterium]|nr:xylan 1,4-beta-xylosidase [Kiritimatiellia bacterium]
MNRIRIAADADLGLFGEQWRTCVGSSCMRMALYKEYQDALALVQSEIGFRYVRGHGLFHDGVGIYRTPFRGTMVEQPELGPALNFVYADRIYDAFLANGIRPMVELSFMPDELASGSKTVFCSKGNVTPPSDWAAWRQLVKDTAAHFVARYGLAEVRTWLFEVWNEPNGASFWSGTMADYFRLYREAAFAVKEVDAELAVGGPATCGSAYARWIESFLSMCETEKAPVDFVSTHAYYGKKVFPKGEFLCQYLAPPAHVLEHIRHARSIVQASPFPDLPLHISEYNTSFTPFAPIHDSALNAAYLGRLLSEGGDLADSFAYFTFSDAVEEVDIPRAQFYGGFGLVAAHGIPKPTFHLFAFFARLGNTVAYRDENMLVTRHPDGRIVLVAWNPVPEWEETGPRSFDLELSFPAKEAVIERQTVDEERGNAWTAWRRMGRPRSPVKDQLRILRQAAIPYMEIERREPDHGVLKLNLTLARNAVCLVDITERIDESPTYLGLGESPATGIIKQPEQE